MPTQTNTATVEVLTAEVRVLMVGSRQVTLSVWKQLDYVDPLYVMAFGRVGVKISMYPTICVVGKHINDGSLVRSSCSPPHEYSPEQREYTIAQEWAALPLIVLAGLR